MLNKSIWQTQESGSVTVIVAVAISLFFLLTFFIMQVIVGGQRIAQTQNLADLTAISVAQKLENGSSAQKACDVADHIVQEVLPTAKTRCEITAKIANVVVVYPHEGIFIFGKITGKAKAGVPDMR